MRNQPVEIKGVERRRVSRGEPVRRVWAQVVSAATDAEAIGGELAEKRARLERLDLSFGPRSVSK